MTEINDLEKCVITFKLLEPVLMPMIQSFAEKLESKHGVSQTELGELLGEVLVESSLSQEGRDFLKATGL